MKENLKKAGMILILAVSAALISLAMISAANEQGMNRTDDSGGSVVGPAGQLPHSSILGD